MVPVSVTNLWASAASWFLPSTFFVLLNVVIGTIVVISSLKKQKGELDNERRANRAHSLLWRLQSLNLHSFKVQHVRHSDYAESEEGKEQEYELPRTILEKLRSLNLHSFKFREVHPFTVSENNGGGEGEEKIHNHAQDLKEMKDLHLGGNKSDSQPVDGEKSLLKLSRMMKKSASLKSDFAHFEEAEIVRRPSTTRETKTHLDDEVDAKADDFINRFREQLKLQRLESLKYYKEMLHRGK